MTSSKYLKSKKWWKKKLPKDQRQKTREFYLRPKANKKGNSGHPVVGSVNCHTSKNQIRRLSFAT